MWIFKLPYWILVFLLFILTAILRMREVSALYKELMAGIEGGLQVSEAIKNEEFVMDILERYKIFHVLYYSIMAPEIIKYIPALIIIFIYIKHLISLY